MPKLSQNFDSSEFACRCGCGFDRVSPALVAGLQRLRDIMDRPVRVTSGCRCPDYNRSVRGKPGSQHLAGRAADVVIDAVPPVAVAWIAAAIGAFPGIIVYPTWTHLDVRTGPPYRKGL